LQELLYVIFCIEDFAVYTVVWEIALVAVVLCGAAAGMRRGVSPIIRSCFAVTRHIVEECYDLERTMGGLSRYFDYEAFGRELFMYDYTMGANNNVFRNI